jgi:hypothetical protein
MAFAQQKAFAQQWALQLQLGVGRTDHASHNSRPLRRFAVPLNAGYAADRIVVGACPD